MKILITGASSGIGKALSYHYATKENELILLARREENLQKIINDLQDKVKSISYIVADVREFKILQTKLQSITSLDMVILNAGIALGHGKKRATTESFKNLFDVNLFANHAILEVILPIFERQQSGKIVFISSISALFAMPSAKIYSASKVALNNYAQALRYKYKKQNIKVITILPGFIKSELTDKNDFYMPFLLSTQEGAKRIVQAIEKNKREYTFPKRLYYLIKLLNFLPSFLREMIVNRFEV
jgi:short-subunit dehydrogenase